MSVIGSNLLAGASGSAAAGYEIERSLRFDSGSSAYLNRTPSSAGNRRTFTWSGWVKRSGLGAQTDFFSAGNSSDYLRVGGFNSSDKLELRTDSAVVHLVTDQVFRDLAWYHIVIAVDTSQSTTSNRVKFYVNGSQITNFSTSTYPSQNSQQAVNDTGEHRVGAFVDKTSATVYYPFDGYLAEVYFIDGQQLAASDFGEYDSSSVWQAKDPTFTSPNDGTTWSSSLSSAAGFQSSQPATNVFDGDIFSKAATPSNTGGYFTGETNAIEFIPPSSIPFTSSVKVTGRGTGQTTAKAKIDTGSGYGSEISLSSDGIETVISGSGNLVKLKVWTVTYAGENELGAILIDDVPLVDGAGKYGTNGFKLDFSDNSSNAALGTDSSGNSNTWTVNNLVADGGVVYSNYVSGYINSLGSEPTTNLFDGNTSTSFYSSTISGSGIKFVPPTDITGSIELYLRNGDTANSTFSYSLDNGSTFTNLTTTSAGSYVSIGSQTIGNTNGIIVRHVTTAGTNSVNWRAIRVDSTVLTDGTPSNTDSLFDSPTNGSQSDGGNGAEVSGNYCCWNPLNKGSSITTSDGNLKAQLGSTGHVMITGTMGMTSGKYYWEVVTDGWNTSNQGPMVGVVGDTHNIADQAGGSPSVLYRAEGVIYVDGSSAVTGQTTYTTGDVIGVALDLDNDNITWYKNGVQMYQYTSLSASVNTWIPAWKDSDSGGNAVGNWGQRAFAHAQSGFKGLCTANLSDTTVKTSGSYTGNSNADGPFVYLNGVPTAMTIGGSAVTFGTNIDRLSNGFKIRSATTNNTTGTSYSYSVTTAGDPFKTARAQLN